MEIGALADRLLADDTFCCPFCGATAEAFPDDDRGYHVEDEHPDRADVYYQALREALRERLLLGESDEIRIPDFENLRV